MNLTLARHEANIMHIDLNSAFATTEQQAHRCLRGIPVGVTNRTPHANSICIAVSYEGKALGIKVGTTYGEAKAIAPNFVMLESDPAKYHHVYRTLVGIMSEYSPDVQMLSIDEGIIDFTSVRQMHHDRSLEAMGYEIKARVKEALGKWMRINVGIGPNRFLAKQAAIWHKPDGLDTIDHRNLMSYYKQRQLQDLNGIGPHFDARLRAHGIPTPLEFLKADANVLRRQVFRSTTGLDWYARLRGYEMDANPTKLGNVGRQYVLDSRKLSQDALISRFQFLCETTAKKLRYRAREARGLIAWIHYAEGDNWSARRMHGSTFYTNKALYERLLYLLKDRPHGADLTPASIGLTCYELTPSTRNQMSLFDEINKEEWLTTAVDEINERYGNFAVFSANALLGKQVIKQKIPFGGTDYFELLLKQA